uniref:Succinate:cytochrome c oxidoreductase subunit 3 n=1 Tax=Marophrys sp. SRT127 TaxID=2488311 RepID=A0A455RFR4_9EUKA|nr:succinate:cytochrome c oxidoreductase subunit 3 [Marophrys sp. SRT127]
MHIPRHERSQLSASYVFPPPFPSWRCKKAASHELSMFTPLRALRRTLRQATTEKESMYRPLSPHISIYKPQISSTFSVFHRATGIILTLGLLFLIFSLKFFIYHVTYYPIYLIGYYSNTYLAWILIGILFVLAQSFFWHMSGGMRHLMWDFSSEKYLTKDKIDKSAYFLLGMAVFVLVIFAAWVFA